MLKLAISGKARSGKTCLAEAIIEYFDDLQFAWLESFACPLRALADSACLTKSDPHYRPILQGTGDLARSVCEDFFVNGLARRLAQKVEMSMNVNSSLAVIHDLRFPNEARWCQNNGFVLVRVECPEHLRRIRYDDDILFDAMADHISETALDCWENWDIVLHSSTAPIEQNLWQVLKYLKVEES